MRPHRDSHHKTRKSSFHPKSTTSLSLTAVAYTLVEETARAQWFMQRNHKRVEQVEWNLPGDAYQWSDDDHKQYTNATRYKTTAERAFFRFFKELEGYYHRLDRAEEVKTHALAAAAKLNLEWLNEMEKTKSEQLRIAQVTEVEEIEGQTRTSHYPTDEQLINEATRRPELPLCDALHPFRQWRSVRICLGQSQRSPESERKGLESRKWHTRAGLLP